jgi:probable HAF family extracellular repeat protein
MIVRNTRKGKNMNQNAITKIGRISLLFLLVVPVLVTTQKGWAQVRGKQHAHYKIIDTGSFGGPNSHMNLGAHILNNNGMLTGFADTAEPDPYAPDGCWDGDCLVAHTFRWSHGELTELGVVDGGPNSESNWLSENGLIAGDSQNGLLDPLVGFWQIRGVLWRGDETIDVGTLGGGYNSLARGVNTNGVVVGLSTTLVSDSNAMIMSFGLPYAFQTRAFRWKNGHIQDLGTLGGPDAMALGVNESGQIFGNSYTSFDASPVCGNPDFGFDALTTGAFLWQNGKMTNLGSLGGTCTNAIAINNRGQVIGYSFLAGDEVFHPFRWERGKLVDLGTLGGNQGVAQHLNESGDIVGWESLAGNEDIIHATLWSRGQITDLGAFEPDQCSVPFAINSRKQVVGLVSLNCDLNDDPSLRAFLWEPGSPMLDLNTLISPSLGIQLRNVATINDRGEMAAVAFFPDGNHRPVLLIPCDENDRESCLDSSSAIPSIKAPVSSTPRALTSSHLKSESIPMNLRARLAGIDKTRVHTPR